jgi:ATP-dependent Clp protease ATP-binding subunit ClpA
MAVLFLAHMENGEMKDKGLCLKCARELNIPQVKEVMDKLGLSDDEIETMSDQMSEFMGGDTMNLDGDFEVGGTQPLPFLQNLFNQNNRDEGGKLQPTNPPGSQRPPREERAKKEQRRKRKFLDNFCENLTEKAKEGRIDNIVGRDNEIYRVIQILNRRTKNNPCLIGEPGVGKTAIAEGIAIRLASGNVPPRLADKELFLLDLTALVAGTQFRGQFESRVKGLLNEIKESGNVILFIDEVHNIVGAGDSEGSMNTANILKPALARGELQCIGATTLDEYRESIEKDSALERRFQKILVKETTPAQTLEILNKVKAQYEKFHSVSYTDEALRACVDLTARYITDRNFPDKAIDALDEAGAVGQKMVKPRSTRRRSKR